MLFCLYILVNAKNCELPKDEAGIIWDSICFAFLLLQRRVFMSYYFLHVVADIRASQILASRYLIGPGNLHRYVATLLEIYLTAVNAVKSRGTWIMTEFSVV